MAESKLDAWEIVKKMLDQDEMSKWLGIELIIVEPGHAKISMTVRKDMVNGFGIAHGGITYSLADSALAFAANGHGRVAVSTNTSISHFKSVKVDDKLTAVASELNLGENMAYYRVDVLNQDDETVAGFDGSVYRTAKIWE
jgi:acyl-CoA thioesterase